MSDDGLSAKQRAQLRERFRNGMGSKEVTPEILERFAHMERVLALAAEIEGRLDTWPADMWISDYEAPYIAQAVLASTWLAEHDAAIRADAT